MTFTSDLAREKYYEQLIADTVWWVLSEDRLHDVNVLLPIEVKHDYMFEKTGNVAVEILCSWKPSGISIWRWFIFYILWEDIYWCTKTMLRQHIKEHYSDYRRVLWWDGNRADMILIPYTVFTNIMFHINQR